MRIIINFYHGYSQNYQNLSFELLMTKFSASSAGFPQPEVGLPLKKSSSPTRFREEVVEHLLETSLLPHYLPQLNQL